MKLTRAFALLFLAFGGQVQGQSTDFPGPAPAGDHVDLPFVEKESCGPRAWFDGEYLLWWFKGSPIPLPLLTTAPAGSTSALPGAIGNPDTGVLFGTTPTPSQAHSGFRVGGGAWLSDSVGVEGGYFRLFNRTSVSSFSASGAPGSPFLAAPFQDAQTGAQSRVLLGAPGLRTGFATFGLDGQLQGADLNALGRMADTGPVQVDALAGFRWLALHEQLSIDEGDTRFAPPPGVTTMSFSQYQTRNDFYGGQVGLRLRTDSGPFFAIATGKLALGLVDERVRITGAVTRFGSGTFPGDGIITEPTTLGSLGRTHFAWAPQVGAKVGVHLTERAYATVGYDFLYISDVARPGNSIDPVNNRSQSFGGALVGAPRPAPILRDSIFYAHGLSFGLGFEF